MTQEDDIKEKKYNAKRLSEAKQQLKEMKVSQELMVEYYKALGRLDYEDIASLVKNKITPEQAGQYNKRFGSLELCVLIEAKISPEQTAKFASKFNGISIRDLTKINCSPEQANSYPERFKSYDVYCLANAGIPPEKAIEYEERFNGETIAKLTKLNVTPKQANAYDKSYCTETIIELTEAGITQEQIKELYEEYDFCNLFMRYDKLNKFRRIPAALELVRLGFTPEIMKSRKININLLKHIASKTNLLRIPTSHKLIGTGVSGIVFSWNESAWKFSQEINHEYELLKRIQEVHQGKQKHIIKLKSRGKRDEQDLSIEIEHIQGNTLEEIMKNCTFLPTEKVIKYSSGIMDGLVEMRRAGIWYHRDIRPANIMINEKDIPVVLDLGIATTNKHALPKDNCRYGSPSGFLANDIISLGQVMYYMAAGKHLFADSKSMTNTYSDKKEEIKDSRNKAYADVTGRLLQEHFAQIDKTIQDKKVAALIKACLTARRGQYKITQRIFNEIKN